MQTAGRVTSWGRRGVRRLATAMRAQSHMLLRGYLLMSTRRNGVTVQLLMSGHSPEHVKCLYYMIGCGLSWKRFLMVRIGT